MIESKILLAYRRDLSNLSIQEGRLRRQREKDTASLRELQNERKRRTKLLDNFARDYIRAVHEGRKEKFILAAFGFEFSATQIEVRALEIEPDLFADFYLRQAEADAAAKKAA